MSEASQFEVLEGYQATEPWLDEVCKASDSHRNEFGFLARSVFDQFARRDDLLVLISHTTHGDEYVGHLLFDRRFPRAHVRQMFVRDVFRRSGAASCLLDRLRELLTQNCFISIYARVAEDLTNANAFWQRQRFHVQRSEKGGATRNRQILVRCHELESPQLFPASGLNDENPLGLAEPTSNDLPVYLLDMNVLFDIQPRRLRRSEIVGLFQAERMNFCRLAISSEVREELRRNLTAGKTDPMEAYVETFPCYPVHSDESVDLLFSELAGIIFPKELHQRPLNANEKSDIRHVATAIQHNLSGLITNDTALLNAGAKIERNYRVQVLSSSAFELEETLHRGDDSFQADDKQVLRLLSVTESNETAVRDFLSSKTHLTGATVAVTWLPMSANFRIAVRRAVWSGDACIGYVTWPSHILPDGVITVRAAVDETHSQSVESARLLLLHLMDHLRNIGPCKVVLELPLHQSHLREVGSLFGFVSSSSANVLAKSLLGKVITPLNWSIHQQTLVEKGGPRLPLCAPSYTGPDQLISIHTPNGNKAYVSLDRLESLLGPTLLCLSGRPAVISPVRHTYADLLLGHSPQGSLLPQISASLYTERLYLSDPSSLKHFKRGTLMFFYESGKGRGHSEIVAIGRVREAFLKPCDELGVLDLRQSALTTETLIDIGKSTMKSVTLFDSIFPLPNPVGLSMLKRLGYGRPNDLITTHAISNSQTQAILEEGFCCG